MQKKVSKNIDALVRVSQYINLSKRGILMNPLLDSKFKFCPVIWICTIVTQIIGNWQTQRKMSNNKQSSFKELLEKDSSVFIHERNVQIVATEKYRIRINFSLPHKNEIFEARNEFPDKTKLSVFQGFSKNTEIRSYLGPSV